MKKFILALLLGTAVFAAMPANAEFVTVTGTPRVIDGDTFDLNGERIRLEGPDAPESRKARCPHERVVAIQATNRLRELLGEGPLLLERRGIDKYGRTLARVFPAVGEHEVGEMLMAEGLAIEWRPGRKAWASRARWWCGSNWQEIE